MVEINKNTLISDVDSIISGLTLSTEDTEVLSLMYKAAINAGANANTIVAELTSRIEAASSNTTITDALLLSVMTDILTVDREMKVANLAALDALTNISTGSVYYVESLEVPYIKTSGGWEPVELNSQLGDPLVIGNFAYGWGCNTAGTLGDNTTLSKNSPVSVVGGFTDWIDLKSGRYFTIGLRANGTIWSWGCNTPGTLGDNTTIDKSSPVSVVGGFTDWTQIGIGLDHVLAVRANGTAWAWGNSSFGRLGDGNSTNRSSPVSIIGGYTDWVAVGGGQQFSIGLRSNGTIWSWGQNSLGHLGSGNTSARSSPTSVVGGYTDWTQIGVGQNHTIAIRANGTAWAWGFNGSGQLGDGTTTNRSSPVSVIGGYTDWVQVSGAGTKSFGVRADGTAWAWGLGSSGQLGDNTTVNKSSPVSVVGGFTDWIQVGAHINHSLGVRADGTVWAWGCNLNGRLGDGGLLAKSSPVSVVGGFTDWIRVGGGSWAVSSAAIRSGIV